MQATETLQGMPTWLALAVILFGGGGLGAFIVQVLTFRPNRRKAKSEAELNIAAAAEKLVEQGMSMLEPYERQLKSYAVEQTRLVAELDTSKAEVRRLNDALAEARAQVAKLTGEIELLHQRIRRIEP